MIQLYIGHETPPRVATAVLIESDRRARFNEFVIRLRHLPVLALLILLACTSRASEIECAQEFECNLEEGGKCVEACSGRKWCAYPESASTCPSGQRWSAQQTGDGLSGECIEEEGICVTDM